MKIISLIIKLLNEIVILINNMLELYKSFIA